MAEAAVISAIKNFLLFKHCLVIRINSGAVKPAEGRFVPFNRWQVLGDDEHTAGVSDLFALTPWGQWIVIECKSDTGQLTNEQQLFRAEVIKRGGAIITARSIDDLGVVFK